MDKKSTSNEMMFRTSIVVLVLMGIDVAHSQVKYPFDRVFTSASQREALDSQRRTQDRVDLSETENTAENNGLIPISKKENVTLSGWILGRDGKPVYWIDGKISDKVLKGQQAQIVTGVGGSNTVSVKYDSQIKSMKPGQVWLLEENTIREAYQLQANQDVASPGELNEKEAATQEKSATSQD